jgi:hypothetical protein
MTNQRQHAKTDGVLLFTPGLEGIEAFCQPLNTEFTWISVPSESGWLKARVDYRPVQRELRRLVQAWFDSGPNSSKLFKSEPLLARAAARFPAHMIPTETGQTQLVYVTAPENMKPGDPVEIALGLFLSFLLNPHNYKLAGPCKQCENYYVKKTKRQIAYCSGSCGRRFTSRESNQSSSQKYREEKTQRAQSSLNKWVKAKTKLAWKDFVHQETRISKNFLTRTEKQRLLVLPQKAVGARF